MVHINAAKKALFFNTVFTRKVFSLLQIFKKSGIIRDYKLFKSATSRAYIRVYAAYHNDLPLSKSTKLISTPSRTFYVSYNALRFVEKRTGGSVFLISTNHGIVAHKTAVQNRKGGVIVGSFSI
jgi:ribosomal protein S8